MLVFGPEKSCDVLGTGVIKLQRNYLDDLTRIDSIADSTFGSQRDFSTEACMKSASSKQQRGSSHLAVYPSSEEKKKQQLRARKLYISGGPDRFHSQCGLLLQSRSAPIVDFWRLRLSSTGARVYEVASMQARCCWWIDAGSVRGIVEMGWAGLQVRQT